MTFLATQQQKMDLTLPIILLVLLTVWRALLETYVIPESTTKNQFIRVRKKLTQAQAVQLTSFQFNVLCINVRYQTIGHF